jgi:hypothetical protein
MGIPSAATTNDRKSNCVPQSTQIFSQNTAYDTDFVFAPYGHGMTTRWHRRYALNIYAEEETTSKVAARRLKERVS